MSKRRMHPNVISFENLYAYRHLTLTWFAEVALKLLLGLLDLTPQLTIEDIRELYDRAAHFVEEEREKYIKKGIDICKITLLPLTGNDPKDLLNICSALMMLSEFINYGEVKYLTLTPALSLEFAEFTRSFMGPWKRKRTVLKVRSDALALAIIGAYISYAYRSENEYCYVFIDVPQLKLSKLVLLNKFARNMARQVLNQGEGSINTVIVGAASRIASDEEIIKDLAEDEQSMLSMVRIRKTGNKVMLKAFDLIELKELAWLIRRLKISYSLVNLIRNYPSKVETSRNPRLARYRRYVETVSMNILKYYWLRNPAYLYDVVRPLYVENIKEAIVYRLGDNAERVILNILHMVRE